APRRLRACASSLRHTSRARRSPSCFRGGTASRRSRRRSWRRTCARDPSARHGPRRRPAAPRRSTSAPTPRPRAAARAGGGLPLERPAPPRPPFCLTASEGVSTLVANTRSTAAPATLRTQGAPVLTARQQEIWNFLVEYVDQHGYPPTVREIGERVGLASPS